jgi:hypothetical protein
MDEEHRALDVERRTHELLAAGAAAELRLLKEERKAEKRLAKARGELAKAARQLEKAQRGLARSRAAVDAADADLRQCQARRAAGAAVAQD